MREITRERLVQDTDILLFDILQELKRFNLRADLETMPVSVPVSVPFIVPHEPYDGYIKVTDTGTRHVIDSVITTATSKVKGFKCKYCGGTHEKAWQIAKCGKNLKEEGAK